MMQAKYTSKMEDMILQRFKGNSNKQMETAEVLFLDFQNIYSEESLVGMNATKVRDKYQSLRRYGPNFTGSSRNDKAATLKQEADYLSRTEPNVLQDTAPKVRKTSKTLRPKDRILEMLKESNDMTITIKGTEITVVFK